MSKYVDYMCKLSLTELEGYLGEDIIEALVEWDLSGESSITRERVARMIDSIYGASMLSNSDFRRDLIMTMDKKTLFDIRDNSLLGREKDETDPYILIEIISSKPWGKNVVSRYLLKVLELSTAILEKGTCDTEVCLDIESGERFYELLDYQYYIKQRVLNTLNSGNKQERMLIHMPTGTGKTKTSMHIVTNYIEFTLQKSGLIVWVAHTTELLQQAYDTFVDVWKNLGDGSIKAYRLWGVYNVSNTDDAMEGIAFCGLAKLMSMKSSNPKFFERLKRDCRLLVFDEAHKASAHKTQQIIEELLRMPKGYENRALIGLSATPGRTTQQSSDNNLLSNMFGNKLIYIDSIILNQINYGRLQALNQIAETNIIRYFQRRRILAKMDVQRLNYEKEFSQQELNVLSSDLRDMGFDEKEYTEKQLKVLATNKSRNKAIMIRLKELNRDGVPTIVFACSVQHAKMLSAMLTLDEIPNSLILGEMNPVDRKHAIDDFKNRDSKVNTIINYEVLTTGFDSKNIRCVFITRPTKSIVLYSQMLGRGLRGPMMGGNESCTLIDINDNLESFDNETAFFHFDDYWRR